MIETSEGFFQLPEDSGINVAVCGQGVCIHDPGQSQDDVQIGLGGDAEFVGSRTEGFDVAGDKLFIQCEGILARPFQA